MKKIFQTLAITAISCALSVVSVHAETHPVRNMHDGTVHAVNTDTVSGHDIYETFAVVSPHAFNVPNAPRFAFVGKDKKFYLGVGGTIKGTVGYDFGDPIANPNFFTTSAINMAPAPGNKGKFAISAQQSSLFLNFVALPDNPNQIGVYIQGTLLGNNYLPSLTFAYAKWRGFTVGYDYSLFTDLSAAPPTIDYEGPNAMTAVPNAVIDYRHQFNKWLSGGVGVELPQASYTNGSNVSGIDPVATTSRVSQRVPDIPAYLQAGWGDNSWFRVSGIVRNMMYRDNVAATNHNVVGWGVKASGSLELLPQVTLYYQGVYGKGIASYIQDLSGQGMDMVPDATDQGKLKPVEAWGAYAGLQYNILPNLYVSATYSHVRVYPEKYSGGTTDWGNQYKYAQYIVGNCFWELNPIVTLGVEYLWGRRVDMSGVQQHNNRVQTMFQVSF